MKFDFSPEGAMGVTHLRLARLWIWLGLMLVFGICVMSLISVPAPVRSLMLNDKLMHVAVYACLMSWFAQIFRHDLARLVFVVVFVLMGIGIEYLQGLTPSRRFEVLDMIANTCGVLLAWALAYTWMGKILEWFEKSMFSLVAKPA